MYVYMYSNSRRTIGLFTGMCMCVCKYDYEALKVQKNALYMYTYVCGRALDNFPGMFMCFYLFMYVCMYVRMYVCMYVCMYVQTFQMKHNNGPSTTLPVYTYVCMYVYM
jgi:hypothetical protein